MAHPSVVRAYAGGPARAGDQEQVIDVVHGSNFGRVGVKPASVCDIRPDGSGLPVILMAPVDAFGALR
jgi:hypothetical protein